ncbi:MAG TPA: dihydrofolate reductase family protein [Solirubrobacterales bacterium]|nr:dihydrofolate reductase family protein [Solirubrobacterales bacterium]
MAAEGSGDRPYVVAHVAISVDGATSGFQPDVGLFYSLIETWDEDATLAGADTILAQEAALEDAPRPGPAAGAPLLAVVDGRCRVGAWDALRECGHWSEVLALRAAASDPEAPASLRQLATGGERVDLRAALTALRGEHGAKVVRVDSGGTLIGALLREGLVDELSLLVHPVLAGGDASGGWRGSGAQPSLRLEPMPSEPLEGGVAWLRYRVLGPSG